MEKHYRLLISLLLSLTLIGCASTYNSQPSLKECWMRQVNVDSKKWTRCASQWFLAGNPNLTNPLPLTVQKISGKPIIATNVPTGDFDGIKIDGNFRVQLTGSREHESIAVTGPPEEVKQVIIEVCGHNLCIHRIKGTSTPISHIIIQVAIHDLRRLINNGAIVEGINITSSDLKISASGYGSVLLDGSMNLSYISQMSSCPITVIGAFTPALSIQSAGSGDVNVSGRVGIQSILHNGSGTINIIGALSKCLDICAKGTGTVAIAGYVTLNRVMAFGRSRVYVFWVTSNNIDVIAGGTACVGLAGQTNNLKVDLRENAGFAGGRLIACHAYVRTHNNAHANIVATQSLLATSTDQSSIYVIGAPPTLARFPLGNSVIYPISTCDWPIPCLPPLPPPCSDYLSVPSWHERPIMTLSNFKGERVSITHLK